MEWRTHDGARALAGADYLVEPSFDIGAIRSAETNRLASGFVPMERMERRHVFEIATLGLVLGWFGSMALVHGGSPLPWEAHLTKLQWETALAITFGLAVVGGCLAVLARARRVSFVGGAGVQLTELGTVRSRTRVVRFADCARLDVSRTRHHFNGAYQHTSFRYRFVDERGNRLLEIRGTWNDRKEPSSMLRFALASQRAWDEWRATARRAS